MKSHLALGKDVLSRFAAGETARTIRTAMRVVAKGAFLVMMAFMLVTYAVSVSQSAAPAPEPLPDYIYS